MPLLLLDIDGTLLLTGGAGRASLNRAYADLFGVADAYEGIRPDGKTDDAILREMHERATSNPLQAGALAQLRDRYIAYFLAELPCGERFRVLPGARELLAALSQRPDCCLGVATGNYEATARAKLARAGLAQHFPFGGYGSDSEDRTEIVRQAIRRGQAHAGMTFERQDIVVVGDSVQDVRCAKRLGARAIAVATGSTSAEALAAEQPDRVLKNLQDPEAFLLALPSVSAGGL